MQRDNTYTRNKELLLQENNPKQGDVMEWSQCYHHKVNYFQKTKQNNFIQLYLCLLQHAGTGDSFHKCYINITLQKLISLLNNTFLIDLLLDLG